MSETIFTKNKVNLTDYDYEDDVKRRLLLASLSIRESEVLEEILYSSIRFPTERICKSLGISRTEITPILDKLKQIHLLEIEQEEIVVDKDIRKTFESEFDKFGEIPGIESLRTSFKRVPIHVLPNWYAIPRSTDNIFDSIIDLFLSTPQKFQRYLLELNFNDSSISCIIQDIFKSPDYKVPAKEVMEKYGLSQEHFEEMMIYLEFNFVCCLTYEDDGDQWIETITFFKEWRDYLLHLKQTTPRPIRDLALLRRTRPSDFAFVEDMGSVLNLAIKNSLHIQPGFGVHFDEETLTLIAKRCGGFNLASPADKERFKHYATSLVDKLLTLELANIEDGQLLPTPDGREWLDMALDKRALELHRHPLNRIAADGFSDELVTEKNIRAAEKSLAAVVDSGWVYLDDFLNGMMIPFSDKNQVILEKKGRQWRYQTPEHDEDEKSFMAKVIMEWLFETSIVSTAAIQDKPCFRVTPFGQTFYD